MLRLVDLSFDIYDKAPTFASDPTTSIIPHLKISDLAYNITLIQMSAHLGTHLDAPYHFFDGGRTVDQLDARRGLGPAWLLDFSHKQPKEMITLADLQPHASKIGPGSRLIFYTGWDKVFPDERYFAEQPMVDLEACRWLAGRGIACIALDTPTINYDYIPTHHALLGEEVLIVEGLCHLDQLQGDRVILIALPLRIRGRDGSPCRAMAIDGDVEPLVELFETLDYHIQ